MLGSLNIHSRHLQKPFKTTLHIFNNSIITFMSVYVSKVWTGGLLFLLCVSKHLIIFEDIEVDARETHINQCFWDKGSLTIDSQMRELHNPVVPIARLLGGTMDSLQCQIKYRILNWDWQNMFTQSYYGTMIKWQSKTTAREKMTHTYLQS